MSDFALYFTLGLEHITDVKAYDHMLFLVALCALFKVNDWKKILILVTAFTIGHSITLALSVLNLLTINTNLIETLIPLTIVVACVFNIIISLKFKNEKSIVFHYLLALIFGLIHGMGFANYLKALLGDSEGIGWQLFAFNVGIEIGQIGIVFCYYLIYSLARKIIDFKHKHWVIGLSIIIALASIKMIF